MKNLKKFAPWVIGIVFLAGLAAAGDVPGVTPADFPASSDAHWFWGLLASPALVAVVTWLAKFVDRWIREQQLIQKNRILANAYEFAAYGVRDTYATYVREIKGANGKLTEEQKNKAMEKTIAAAVNHARKQGVDLIKVVGPEVLRLIVEQVIGDRKGGAFIPGPLSDLVPLNIPGV